MTRKMVNGIFQSQIANETNECGFSILQLAEPYNMLNLFYKKKEVS